MNASTIRRRCMCGGLAVAVVVVAALAQGCANYQARVADGKPLEQAYKGGTMNAYVWGAWVSPEVRSAEDCKRGMYDVVVENNYLYSLVSVVTLGIWMPMDVSYRCKAPGVQGGGVVPP